MGCSRSHPATLGSDSHALRYKSNTGQLQCTRRLRARSAHADSSENNTTQRRRSSQTNVTTRTADKLSDLGDELVVSPFLGLDLDFSQIELLSKIGTGTYGEVFKARVLGHKVALKRIIVPPLTSPTERDEVLDDFEQEVDILLTLKHDNIVTFMGASQREPDLCLAFELLEGSVSSVLQMVKKNTVQVTWQLCLTIARDAALAVKYLHGLSPRVIHRDLKAENLLLTSDFRCKLIDFGLSRSFNGYSSAMTVCGSPCWVAPEVFRGDPYTEKVDSYSFGIVLWELFSGDKPHADKDAAALPYLVARQGLRPRRLSHCPPKVNALMEACWNENSEQRPSFAVILKEIGAIHSEFEKSHALAVPCHPRTRTRRHSSGMPGFVRRKSSQTRRLEAAMCGAGGDGEMGIEEGINIYIDSSKNSKLTGTAGVSEKQESPEEIGAASRNATLYAVTVA